MSRFIDPYVNFYLRACDGPLEFAKAGAIMALSTIALGRRWLDYGKGGIRPNLYTMIVGDSSVARKSTSVAFSRDATEHCEPERVGPSDYTIEGLLRWMNEKSQSGGRRNKYCIFSEEFGDDLARAQAYGGTMQTSFCHLYDGGTFEKVRAKSNTLRIDKPRVSMLSACAYPMMQKYLTANDWSNGFLMRFLFVAPQSIRPEMPVPPGFPQQFWDHATTALEVLNKDLQIAAKPLAVDQQAMALYMNVCDEIKKEIEGKPHIVQTYSARFKISMLKVALLYQIDTDPDAPIDYNSMWQATDFCMNVCWPSFAHAYERTVMGEFDALFGQVIAELEAAEARKEKGILKQNLADRFFGNRRLPEILQYVLFTGTATISKTRDGDMLRLTKLT